MLCSLPYSVCFLCGSQFLESELAVLMGQASISKMISLERFKVGSKNY